MEITRGDDKRFKFARKNKTGEIIEQIADEVYFTVKSTSYIEEYIFQKKLSTGEIEFSDEDFYYRFWINSTDTDGLAYGDYEYDIERIVDGKKRTIAKGRFTIEKEITFVGNEV